MVILEITSIILIIDCLRIEQGHDFEKYICANHVQIEKGLQIILSKNP